MCYFNTRLIQCRFRKFVQECFKYDKFKMLYKIFYGDLLSMMFKEESIPLMTFWHMLCGRLLT